MSKAVKTTVPIESPLDIYKEVVAEQESQIVAHDAHDSRSIIPADNVDADGIPWATVGENIRKGSKGAPTKEDALNIISALLDIDLSIEEVTCTLKPSTPISVDNPHFNGKNEVITSNKKIVGFFVISSEIKNGNGVLAMRSFGALNNTITLQSTGPTAITGTVKLAVLLA